MNFCKFSRTDKHFEFFNTILFSNKLVLETYQKYQMKYKLRPHCKNYKRIIKYILILY